MAVTKEQIFSAADDLAAAGQKGSSQKTENKAR